jgi:hypothetical protein
MSEVIRGTGINQADLISLLTLIRTNFLGVTAKLDLDAGVADTNYAALENFSAASGIDATGIFHQGSVLDYLKTVRTSFNALLTKLDADGTVNDTDYNSGKAMTDLIDNLANGSLTQAGKYEGALVKWLDTYIGKWNATLTKLDSDSGVSGTNFNSLWSISTTLVDATGCVNKP